MAKKSSRPARRIVADRNDNIDLDNPEFIKAWELLQHTKQSIFLTGKAGTGKSTFLRYITAHTRKKYVVLAPTGIAAVNVGGVTLHSFFRIPFKPIVPGDPDFAPNRIKERMKYPGSLVKLIRELELIIIDEISMVRADIIDFVDLLLRTYSGNQREPFGGKQLLFVGDVFQLEPVLTGDMRDILRKFYRDAFFFSAHAFDRINLVPIELRKIYRQSQGEFVELLDRIRMGAATAADISRLNSRCVALSLPVEGEENFLYMVLPVRLKGAQVVFIKNSPDRFWVNGTIGTVTTLTQDLLEVRLENGEIHEVEPEKWSNIKYSFDEKTNKIIETELGSFTQYPVKLAWALTIHKSQGLTFNNVIIDLGRGAFTGGQTYVALSRCRSFEGLTLRSTVAERDIFVNPAILNFSRSFNDPILIDGAMRKAHAEECYENALAKADEGDFSEAFDLFAEGLRAKSILDNKSAMRLARSKLAVIGKLRERVAQLESDIAADRERFRDMAMEYTSLGDDCRIDEMPLPAIANYDKALALLPGHIPALYGRALAAITLEDYSRSLDDLGEVVRLDPANFDAMVRMGMTYYRMDDVHNAMDRCLVALSLSETADCPRQALHGLHSLLADIYDTAGDKSSAHHHREIARRLRK